MVAKLEGATEMLECERVSVSSGMTSSQLLIVRRQSSIVVSWEEIKCSWPTDTRGLSV